MKKTIISIFSCLFFITISSQNLDEIKSQNVYFILFENNELTKKSNLSSVIENDYIEKFNYYYYYFNKKNNNKEKFNFSFNYWIYRNFDYAYDKINKRMLFRLNKSFLRKNKNIIITRKFMDKIGEEAVIDLLFRGSKYIFLIDKSEIKNNKILLREVQFDYIPYE